MSLEPNLGNQTASQMKVANLPPGAGQNVGQPSTSGQPTSNAAPPIWAPGANADGAVHRLVRQQLVLLLHAYKCLSRESKLNGENRQCNLPHCRTMKNVLTHMTSCQAGKSCSVPHCSSSSQIISHWKNYTRNNCPLCLPLKQCNNRRHLQALLGPVQQPQPCQSSNPAPEDMQRAYAALGLPFNTDDNAKACLQRNQMLPLPQVQQQLCSIPNPNNIQPMQPAQLQIGQMPQSNAAGIVNEIPQNYLTAYNIRATIAVLMNNQRNQVSSVLPGVNLITPATVKEWHQSVAPDLRNHLVQKIVQAIFPNMDINSLQDSRMVNLVQYASKVEGDMYEAANSREEYYQFLAEKIYKIQREVDEKRQKEKEMQQQQPATVKQWHQSVAPDLRNDLVQKIVQEIFPNMDINSLHDNRMVKVVRFAKKVEGDIYESANSREEYYKFIAEIFFTTQKKVDEKHQKGKEM